MRPGYCRWCGAPADESEICDRCESRKSDGEDEE